MKNIYICGPTVYSEVHIGNMRPIITFDVFRRSLEALGTKVNLIHNITDIDDKIIEKATLECKTEQEISLFYENDYKEILNLSNVIKPNKMPRVTDFITEITLFISKLIEKGHAYEASGNVYFSVETISTYGELSNRKLCDMKYEQKSEKKHPADFTLWKKTSRGIKFRSPWGFGRPGWHTECSVFIEKFLEGEPLDIHGGGIDLLFPHHENEDAQYAALYGKRISNEWRHVGHVNVDGVKMSKSIGNIFSARKFIEIHGQDTLRMIFLTTSYSSPINISEKSIVQAKTLVEKFRKNYIKILTTFDEKSFDVKPLEIAKDIKEWKFAAAMKKINLITKDLNKNMDIENSSLFISTMRLFGFKFSEKIISKEEKKLFEKWKILKNEKNFKEADLVRNKLIKLELI